MGNERRRIYCAFYAFLCQVLLCYAKRGFVFTAPKVLDAGTTEYFTVALFDVPNGGSITLKLLENHLETVIAESKVFAHNNYNTWIRMDIPDVNYTSVRLRLQGTFADGYKINEQTEVKIRRKSVIVFIQTDKPIYKPGQKVRFRIMPMDSQLLPLTGKVVGDIWIEDPTGIRVAQWSDVDLSEGMVQMELPLSNEPVYGTWELHTIVRATSHSQTFRVEEYVLPKFDVVITPPSFVMADTEEISVSVCAKYTYGKNVDGVLHAKITYQRRSFEKEDKILPLVEHEEQISGCTEILVDANELFLGISEFGYRTIQIFAKVAENGTGITQNASATLEISHTPLKLSFLGAEKDSFYFKPGLPYHGQLKVLNPDGTLATSEVINICATLKTKMHHEVYSKLCNTFSSDKDGLIKFTIPPQSTDIVEIELEAKSTHQEKRYSSSSWLVKIYQPQETVSLSAWFSPSKSFLQIEPINRDIQCDKLEKVLIRYTSNRWSTIKFYHQVISRGRIVQLGSHSRTFYANENDKKGDDEDEEDPYVLKPDAPKQQFGLYQAPVKADKLHDTYIGEFMFSLDARATMSPVARLLVFYVRDDGEIVADSRTFKITHCLRNQVKLLFRHSQQYPSTEAAILLSASPSSLCGLSFIDKSIYLLHSEQKFNKEKVFKLMESFDVGQEKTTRFRKICSRKDDDDLRRRKRSSFSFPMPRQQSQVDAAMAFEKAGAVVLSDLILETLPCITPPPRIPPPGFPGVFYSMAIDNNIRLRTFSVDDESTEKEKTELVEEIRSYFPETWLWELHEIGKSGEIALKKELPHTITKWIGEGVCVHPKHGLGISDTAHITAFQPFFASFNLPYSVIRGETVSVVVSVFNYLSSCLPIKLSLEPSESYTITNGLSTQHMCVCGQRSKTAKFLLSPVVLGHINITVYAYTVKEEQICGNELTLGISARDAVTRQLIVEAEGFPTEKTYSTYFCPQNTNGSYAMEMDLLLPENVVIGSARAYMSVTGDLMGPALSSLEELVRLPVGCGEQNMVLFTPNIYILDYLTSTGRINEDVKSRALDYMRKGYQRELRYRHEDGSYSAFGKADDEGSMWLTAFVVKSFAQARRFIAIDEVDLAHSTTWIVMRQLENGCFLPSGHLLNQALQGGLKGDRSLSPLTAFVLISLLEAGFNDSKAIKSALFCLQSHPNPSTYTLSIFAYAAALAKQKSLADGYLQDIEARAVKDGNMMYWDLGGHKSIAINVETAGYVILSMLEIGGSENIVKALPVVRWVAKQRNSNGGFVSTQDTVVALQALAKYSSFVFKEKLDIEINIESDELVHGFKVNQINQLLMQTVKIPVLPTVVDLQASGEGCALAQFILKYNVENSTISDAFDLKVIATRQGSSDCNLPTIGICMRYKIARQVSNMAVLEVNMVSGYKPDKWSIYEIQNDEDLGMKRHEFTRNTEIFYFKQLSNEQKCFRFSVKSEIEVENEREATVKLYDYYQPELNVATSYNIPSFCSLTPLPDLPQLLPVLMGEECASTKRNQGDEEDTECLKDADDKATTGINMNTVETTKQEYTTLYEEDGDILLGDGPNHDVHPDSHLIEQFTDMDVDLSFPDGIEGNQPVSVLPPQDFISNQNYFIPECPVCLPDFPENFTNIYCSSVFALRVSIRNTESGAMKILHDISSQHVSPIAVRAFGILLYHSSCNCTELKQGTVVFVFSNDKALWKASSSAKHELKLSSNITLIAAPSTKVQPPEVKNSRKYCT